MKIGQVYSDVFHNIFSALELSDSEVTSVKSIVFEFEGTIPYTCSTTILGNTYSFLSDGNIWPTIVSQINLKEDEN